MESTHKLYEMSDVAWALIEPHTLGRKGTWGGNAKDNRQFCNGSFWIVSTGATWRELPPEYGCWRNANKRFARWRNDGVWEKILEIIIGQPEFEWLTTPRYPNAGHKAKTQSARYIWPFLRMICRSEALLQKIPRLIGVQPLKSDVSPTDHNQLAAKLSHKKEAKEMGKKRKVEGDKGENMSGKKVKDDTRSKVSYKVTLTQEERTDLQQIATSGKHGSQKVLNAIILLGCDAGEFQDSKTLTAAQLTEVLPVSMRKVERIKQRFVEQGLDVALNKQKPDREYSRKIDGDVEAHLIALACSEPPPGYAKWSLRLLADKLVELKIVDSISHETIRVCLKKTL